MADAMAAKPLGETWRVALNENGRPDPVAARFSIEDHPARAAQ